MSSARLTLLLALSAVAFAEDSLHIVSPNGQVEASVGVVTEPGAFLRIAYKVNYRGKPLIATSYMGFWIHNQEPILGQNLGLTDGKTSQGEGYNSATGWFLQDGSLGRRINVEMRVYDDGFAFRYIIPRTSTLEDLFIDTEETEVDFAQDGAVLLRSGGHAMLSTLGPEDVPVAVEQPGLGWVSLGEAAAPGFPTMTLHRDEGRILKTRLSQRYEGVSPLSTAWRVFRLGPEPQKVLGLPR